MSSFFELQRKPLFPLPHEETRAETGATFPSVTRIALPVQDSLGATCNELQDLPRIERIPLPKVTPEAAAIPSDFDCRQISHPVRPLTNTAKGLCQQAAALNLVELADALLEHMPLMNVCGNLAVYHAPCWRLYDKKLAIRELRKKLSELYPQESRFLSIRQLRDIYSLLLGSPDVPVVEEVPLPDYHSICCLDGLFDIKKRKVIPNSPQALRFSFIKVHASDIGCGTGTHFESFVSGVTDGDAALRQLILEMIGIIITGFPAKAFFVLRGPSGTGKSQIALFLRELLGTSACHAVSDINKLSGQWTTGILPGKLLCLCSDIPDKPLTSSTISVIKQLTGDDPIEGERKFASPFVFKNAAKLLFLSNYPLRISDTGHSEDAFFKRMVEIPFRIPCPQDSQIPHFYKLLLKESGYILGCALDALREFINRNCTFTEVTPLPENMNEYSGERATIRNFVYDCCYLDPSAQCTVGELYQAFQEYTSFSENMPSSQFSKALLSMPLDIHEHRTSKARGYLGIGLLKENPRGTTEPQ